MELGGEGDYIPIATLSPPERPALKWAAMRAILMFRNCEGQSHNTVSTDHKFGRERRAEADSNRGPSAYQLNVLPLGQTGSQKVPNKNFSFILWSPLHVYTFLNTKAMVRPPPLPHNNIYIKSNAV